MMTSWNSEHELGSYATTIPMPSDVTPDTLRLITKIARLYHEHDIKQPEIATRLGLSQARVSRLLKQAQVVGIVRTTVHPPLDMFTDLEEQVEDKYGLREVVVIDTGSEEEDVIPMLGTGAALYLQTALVGAKRIGISSWSETLLACVNAMRPVPQSSAEQVIQTLGGLGQPSSQAFATRLTERLAQLLGAQAIFLPVPGVVSSQDTQETLLRDSLVKDVFALFDQLDLVLQGIGSLNPSRLIRESGNILSEDEQKVLLESGAVGDISQRFFNINGKPIETPLNMHVLGISVSQLQQVPKRVGIAGGVSKYNAIRAAAIGGWIDVLITDQHTARRLNQEKMPLKG